MIKKTSCFFLCLSVVAMFTSCSTKKKIAMEELNDALNGEWLIESAGNDKFNDQTLYPTLYFNSTEKQYSAFDGCNHQSGSFHFDSDNNIIFDAGAATLMMCPNPLNTGISYDTPTSVESKIEKGNEYLILKNAKSGTTKMRKLTLDILDGKWTVESINGETINNPEVTMQFNLKEMKVNGNSGCNTYSGTIIPHLQKPLGFTFSNVAVSMRMCPDMTVERKLMQAIAKIATAEFVDSKHVLLKGSDNTVIRLTRAS